MYNQEQRATIGAICMGLVIVGLVYLVYMRKPFENFANSDSSGYRRCGWSLGTCSDGLRCINGYCKTDVAPVLPALSNLPIRPDRYTWPMRAPLVKLP